MVIFRKRLKKPLTSLTDQEASQPIFRPSWVDRFNDWVSRLPMPAWLFYLSLWVLFIIIDDLIKWLAEAQTPEFLTVFNIFYTFFGIYFLASIHYLDIWAARAIKLFGQAMEADDLKQSNLAYSLTTMPARTVWFLTAATLIGFIFFIRPVIIPLWTAMGFEHKSLASTIVDLTFFLFNAIILVIFIYHTIRQLSWVSKIHETAIRINLFHIRPLYSLSALTARTAGIFVIAGTIIQLQSSSSTVSVTDPYVQRVSTIFPLISLIIYSLLAICVFFLPLHGLHQLLVREKDRLQAEANSRLQAHLQELHQRIDERQVQDAGPIQSQLTSLALERDILAKLPTWPWQPGTLNLLLSAVLLPIFIWIVQQLLKSWF